MRITITIIYLIFCMFIISCAKQPPVMYKNKFYSDNIQYRLSFDEQYCNAVARGQTPMVIPQFPQESTTTYGNATVTDNQGNIYQGKYSETTSHGSNQMLYSGLANLSQSIQASNIYQATREACLSRLGWYRVSNVHIIFDSSPGGANVYAKPDSNSDYVNINLVTPDTLNLVGNTLAPECYKAELGGKFSDEICFELYDVERNVFFKFE